jgi:hypothetical protein
LPLNHQLTDRIPDTWTAESALVAELDLLAERIQGVQRWYTEPVRSPAGWLRTRLADWLDGEGRPRPAHSAELAAAAAEHRRRLAAQRAVADAAANVCRQPGAAAGAPGCHPGHPGRSPAERMRPSSLL